MRTTRAVSVRGARGEAAHGSLEQVQQRFEEWRGQRKRCSPIPGALWKAAVDIANEQGLNQAARALRLNYYDLKKRVEAAEGSGPRPQRAAFVELIAPAASGGAECIVELENARGAKMRIALKGGGADLMALSRAFWERAR